MQRCSGKSSNPIPGSRALDRPFPCPSPQNEDSENV